MYNSYFPFGLAFTHFHPGSDMDSFMEQMLDDVLAPEGDFEDDDTKGHSESDDEVENLEQSMSDSEDETEKEPLPVLEILNRFCLKIREEAMISDRAVERIRSVIISLLRATSQQSKDQVSKILQDNGIDPTTLPELEDAFVPSSWEHSSSELNDHGSSRNYFSNISPREITLGKRRQWKRLKKWKKKDC